MRTTELKRDLASLNDSTVSAADKNRATRWIGNTLRLSTLATTQHKFSAMREASEEAEAMLAKASKKQATKRVEPLAPVKQEFW